MKREVIKVKVGYNVIKCPDSGKFTIVNNTGTEEGGAIISNEDLDVAKKNFKEAMTLSYSIRNLQWFGLNDKWYIPEFDY